MTEQDFREKFETLFGSAWVNERIAEAKLLAAKELLEEMLKKNEIQKEG